MIAQKDLTIADIRRITGMATEKAYGLVYFGEYRVGGRRMVRRDEFDRRRNNGMDIASGRVTESILPVPSAHQGRTLK